MRDGVELCVDLFLPFSAAKEGKRAPVICSMEPYGKDIHASTFGLPNTPIYAEMYKHIKSLGSDSVFELCEPTIWCREYGYTLLRVDVRGIGGSQGKLDPFGLERSEKIQEDAEGQAVEENWSPCLQTLGGHSISADLIAWSSDGSRLASASYETVRIWDPATGQSVSNFPIGFIDSLRFDNDDINLLHTNIGTYDMGSKGPMTLVSDDFISPLKQYGYGLSQGCSWITYNGLKLLWLPSEYRPHSYDTLASL
ncbi:unnamed protein product [Penicillium manginii]